MNTSIATRPQRRFGWSALRNERTISAILDSLRARFGLLHTSQWMFTNQPEHLLAYATWSETLLDGDRDGNAAPPEAD